MQDAGSRKEERPSPRESRREVMTKRIAHVATTVAATGFATTEVVMNGERLGFAIAKGAVLAATGWGLTWCLTAPPDQRWRRTRYVGYVAMTMGTIVIVDPSEVGGIAGTAWAAGAATAAALAALETGWRRRTREQ